MPNETTETSKISQSDFEEAVETLIMILKEANFEVTPANCMALNYLGATNFLDIGGQRDPLIKGILALQVRPHENIIMVDLSEKFPDKES